MFNITDPKCLSDEEISNYIDQKRIQLSVYYSVVNIDLTNYKNPILYFLKEDYYYLQIDRYKFYTYKLIDTQVSTDVGLIFELDEEKKFINNEVLYSDSRTINKLDPFTFSIDIISSYETVIFTRSYIKYLEVASDLGGIIGIISGFMNFFASFFYNYEKSRLMINEFFSYKNVNQNKDKNQLKLYYLDNFFEINNKNNFENLFLMKNKLDKIRSLEDIAYLKKENTDNISFIEKDYSNLLNSNSLRNYNENEKILSFEKENIKNMKDYLPENKLEFTRKNSLKDNKNNNHIEMKIIKEIEIKDKMKLKTNDIDLKRSIFCDENNNSNIFFMKNSEILKKSDLKKEERNKPIMENNLKQIINENNLQENETIVSSNANIKKNESMKILKFKKKNKKNIKEEKSIEKDQNNFKLKKSKYLKIFLIIL